jgi:hypothetical protein
MKQWHKVASYIVSIINFVIGHNFKQNVIWIPLLWKRSLFFSRVNDSMIRIRQFYLFLTEIAFKRRTWSINSLSYYAHSETASSCFVCSQHSFGCPAFIFSSSPSWDTLMINLTDSERFTCACAFRSSIWMMHISLHWFLQIYVTSLFLLLFVLISVIILMNKDGHA